MSTIMHSSTLGCFKTSRSVAPCATESTKELRWVSLWFVGRTGCQEARRAGKRQSCQKSKKVYFSFFVWSESFRKNKDLIDC
jgi:hypothetical protein